MTLKRSAEALFDTPINGNRIDKQWWPPEIRALNPESVSKSEKGIYIKLDSSFVEESGLFIPRPGTTVETGAHSDPDYVLLGEGIYSYHVTG